MSTEPEFGNPVVAPAGATPPQSPAPKRQPAKPKAAAAPKVATAATQKAAEPEDPMERLVCITLHDSKEIPPGGQFVGVNGKQFWIKPGIKVIVPRYVCAALDNAIIGVPDVNEKMQVVGVRNTPRLTYTVHLDEAV